MSPKPFKFPAKRTATIFLLTTTAAAAFTVNSDESSPLAADKIRAQIHGIIRTARAVSTVASTVIDYEFSLRGLPKNSDQYRKASSQVHLRSAERFLKLCEANKGFYVKAGQFIASQKVLPREYSSTLSSLQDQVAPLPFKVIEKVLKDNLGPDFSEKFLSIDEQPIGAASIAQVHHAILKSGQEVAIKSIVSHGLQNAKKKYFCHNQVQYPWIEQQMHFDTRTMYILSKTIAWLYPQYRFEWLPLTFAKTVSSELDFVQEARNSERATKNFRNNKIVRIPHVFWELTTRQVLTMEFYTGHKVAKSLIELFAEMIFVHGYVHGDPHPGNILVSPEGRNGFSLVLLDHAVYRELDEEFRKNFCQLWEALALKDSKKTMWLGERFGAGKYSRYLPIIFTGTTIESKYSSGMSIKEKDTMKQELKSLMFEDLSFFMESMPPDFIAILRVDALLRSTIRKMDVSRLIRLLTYTKYAVYGRLHPKFDGELCQMPETNVYFAVKSVFLSFISTLKYYHILIKILIGAIDSTPWQQKVKNVHNYLYRKFGCSDLWSILVHSVFLLFCMRPAS
ncbi:uncharacterized protein LOC131620896 isoform X2 [Vicia villosa]|uniref:uncharacterized protein LOC131620896 isoform X2 n=1 Tax=Vicia villosa TaxID=3911 RepID=UPI00273CE32B|nr:uncharacterized protein LOC131620896 isoform X2 [Vicia villosa]